MSTFSLHFELCSCLFSRNLLYCSKRKHDITGERKPCQNFYQYVSFLYGCFSESCWQAAEILLPLMKNLRYILRPESSPRRPPAKNTGQLPSDPGYFQSGSGYLTAESDSDDSRMNIQLTAPSGVVYSYFLEPDEQAVLPFPKLR